VRYIYTPEVDLNKIWFGINHAKTDEVAITEGAIDSMWLAQLGMPALAILGSNVREPKKINQLSNFRKVTLFADRDWAGVQSVSFLGKALRQRGVPCMVVTYPTWARGKDPQELTPVDVELLYERAIPYTAWLHRDHLSSK
jgi:DNA primase